MKFKAYYLKPFRNTFNPDELSGDERERFIISRVGPSKNVLGDNYDLRHHEFVREFEARDLEDAFIKSQGEIWSPNGEARGLILSKGLDHTSASFGDIFVDEDGDRYMVDDIGFAKI